jgi:hypothetical protein
MNVLFAPRAIAVGMLLLAGLTSAAQAGWITQTGIQVSIEPQGPGWTVVDESTLKFQPDPGKPAREFKWDNICKTWRDADTGEESKTWDTTYESRDVSDKDRLFIPIGHRYANYEHAHWVPCSDKRPPRSVAQYQTGYDGWPQPSNASVPTSMGFPNSMPLYVQVYGGLSVPGTVMFTTPDDLNSGPTFGGSIGMTTSVPGVSVQVDLDHTRQEFHEFSGDFISTTSVAVLGVADFNGDGVGNILTPGNAPTSPPSPFDFYVGAGPAVQFLSEDYTTGGTATGLGYKALAGVRFAVAGGVSIFGQGQYENTFTTNMATNNFPVQSGSFSVVGGVRMDLPWLSGGR